MRTRALLAWIGTGIVVLSCNPAPTGPDGTSAPSFKGGGGGGGGSPPTPPAPPPASSGPSIPNPQTPAAGAALAQPISLSWAASTAATPIIGYNWQIGTTSAFGAVIVWGSTFQYTATATPEALVTSVSGLANGSYFWRVQAVEQGSAAAGAVSSGWSAARAFTVSGPGAAPGTPLVQLPTATAKFHPWELFEFEWSAVPGAAYYTLEMDNEPAFAYPWTNATYDHIPGTSSYLSTEPGTTYYRIRAVGADGVKGLPSATRTVVVSYNAPMPPPPTPLTPVAGASVAVPFDLTWSDNFTAEGGGYYEVQISKSSSFGTVEWYVIGASASPFPVDALTPGKKWWRIRAYHGYTATGPAITAWSASGTFTVTAP